MAKKKADLEKEKREIATKRKKFDNVYSTLSNQNKLIVYKTLAALAHNKSTLHRIAFYSLVVDKCNVLKITPYQLHKKLSDKMSKETFYTMLNRRQYPGQLASMTLDELEIKETEIETLAKSLELNYQYEYTYADVNNLPYTIEFLYDCITNTERNALLVLVSALHNAQISPEVISEFESSDYFNCPPEQDEID